MSTNDRAVDLLEMIASSLFFEIDLRFGVPLNILKKRPLIGVGSSRNSIEEAIAAKPLSFPSTSFDRRALALYWYGRSASGLPLLRFQAFYQSVEFYFPMYSKNEAIRHAKKMLKDPRFSIHDDGDMARLVNSIQVSKGGSFGDERAQFRFVVESCVDAQSLRQYLESHGLTAFYTDSSQRWKRISSVKILMNDVDLDLRPSIAERLYEIRCRIVHSKSDGGPSKGEPLLPFSREADELRFDTQVLEFISTQTLIASSTPLVI